MDQVEVKENAKLVEVKGISERRDRVLRVESDQLLPNTYIIESSSALQILLQPWIVGARLASLARISSTDFLRVAYHLCPEFSGSLLGNVTEVVPLAGSLYYGIAEAFEAVFGEAISRSFIGAKRQLSPSGWITELAYENFEALPPKPVIFIGDTIATGGTIERIVDCTIAQASDIRAIIIYAIAGGLTGAIRIKQLADRIGVPICLFCSNAIFGVEANGTDMPWLHPGTIASPGNRKKAVAAYGSDLGRRWCSVWDWGERAKNPSSHLERLLERCDVELSSNVSGQTKTIVGRIQTETKNVLDKWNKPLTM
jgi:hypothetical protein